MGSRKIAVRLALLVGLASGCATVTVKTDYDRNVDFGRYRTFEMLGGTLLLEGRPDDSNTLVKDRIRGELVAELSRKGFQLVEAGADLLVSFVAGARTVTEVEMTGPYRAGYGPYWGFSSWWGPVYQEWWTRTYIKGTLIIDIMDSRTQRLSWRAYAEADVRSVDASDLIRKAVRKAFAKFPPRR